MGKRVGRIHCIIPDVQSKPGVSNDHMTWVGNYIAEKRPDVIVQIGDFADMPSLNSHAKLKELEGQRYSKDIKAAHAAMVKLTAPFSKIKGYNPEMILTLGNHEERIDREAKTNPKLEGTISSEDLKYEEFGWEVVPFLKPIKVDGIEYCLAPTQKVLTADLRWVELGTLAIGDKLIGFEEEGSGRRLPRRYQTAIVEKYDLDSAPLYEVVLSDGTIIKATAEHRWLCRPVGTGLRWLETQDLTAGVKVPKLFDVWETEPSRDAGWLAGLFDGEGWLSKPNTKQGGIQLGIAQNSGTILVKIENLLQLYGAQYEKHESGKCVSIRVCGPSGDKLKLLGSIRPQRLLEKFKPEMLGRLQSKNGDISVVSITPIGGGEIVKIKTSTNTFIAEGLPHHNCHYFTSGAMGRPVSSASALLRARHNSAIMGHVQYTDLAFHPLSGHIGMFVGCCYTHDEDYLNPQGNNVRRQIVFLHEVGDGSADPMFVSLKYLKSNYS